MDLFEAIAKRHTYRGAFLPDPVPRSDLRQILRAGIQAPNGCNAQTTSFVAVDVAAIIARICSVLGSPAVPPALIVCVTRRQMVFKKMQFEVEDCCAATENMLLAITALGYASAWTDSTLRLGDRAARIGEILAVPANLRVRVVLPIGRPAEAKQQAKRLPLDFRSSFNRYGS